MELRIHILKEVDCLSQDKGFVVLYNIMRAMVSYKLGRRCQIITRITFVSIYQ